MSVWGSSQPQRTALAWRRTALSVAGAGLVAAKVGSELGLPLVVVMSLVAAAVAVTVVLLSERDLHHLDAVSARSSWPLMAATAVATVGLGIAGVVLALT